MNDPGLDEPINNAASEAHDVLKRDPESERSPKDECEEQPSSMTSPTRWWYASTAFPLIAGESV